MLSCKHTIAQSSDYLEKELSFWKKAGMKMHLVICVNCRNYVKQLKRTILMLRGIKTKEPSEEQLTQLKQTYQDASQQGSKSDG